jgi:hypothetical protein
MDKLLKGSLAIGALLAGFGVFYHYVFFIPTVEREKQERVQAQQREREEAKLTEQREKEEARRARRGIASRRLRRLPRGCARKIPDQLGERVPRGREGQKYALKKLPQ